MDDPRPIDPTPEQTGTPEQNGTPDADGTPAPVPPAPPEDAAGRLARLEEELARARAERDQFKDAAYAFLGELIPYEPITEAELHDMLHGPRGQPLLEVIAEFERELGADHR